MRNYEKKAALIDAPHNCVAVTTMELLPPINPIMSSQVIDGYGEFWEDSGFVFTNELGQHLTPKPIYDSFKKVVADIGIPNARFHDLRHSYAVASIRAGDDIKTVQENLGHATAAFTLNVYAHVTDQMKKESADRMQ